MSEIIKRCVEAIENLGPWDWRAEASEEQIVRAVIEALPVLHVEPLGWDLKLQADGSWKRIR